MSSSGVTSDEERQPLIRSNPNWSRRNHRSSSQASIRRGLDDGHSSTYSSDTIQQHPESCRVRFACFAILSAVVLERISFYGLTGNMVLFLNKDPFRWDSYHAMTALFMFFGITFVFALLGGWIADSCLGRFKCMLCAYLIYICGYMFFPFIANNTDSSFFRLEIDHSKMLHDSNESSPLPQICANSYNYEDEDGPFEENCAWLIYIVLTVVAIGNGVLKSNIVPFGSDQLSRASQHTQLSFFNWFYWCVNLGSFMGLGLMTYLQQQINFHLGYFVCTGCLLAAAMVFLSGSCCYERRQPDGSAITNVFRIIREACRRRRERRQLLRIHRRSAVESSSSGVDEASDPDEERISFLDYAKHRYGGMFHNTVVDDVKKVKVMLGVFAVLVPYWIVYFQMQTTFLFQGLHMRLGSSSVRTPFSNTSSKHHVTHVSWSEPIHNTTDTSKPMIVAAWFSLFDALFVIILLPLFDRVIYPRMSRAGYPFTFTKRIVLGMMFAMAAMFVAGVVEHYRLQIFWPFPDQPCRNASIHQNIGNTVYYAADMSVFWQVPQYALIGISEVFASVACLQFAVSVAPRSMKTLITGLFYFFSGLGSFIGTFILNTLAASKTWIFKKDFGNINCRMPCPTVDSLDADHRCHLDYYFYLLGGLELVALGLFLIVAYKCGLNTDEMTLSAAASQARRQISAQVDEITSGENPHYHTVRTETVGTPQLWEESTDDKVRHDIEHCVNRVPPHHRETTRNGNRYLGNARNCDVNEFSRSTGSDVLGHQDFVRDGGQNGVQNCLGNYDGVGRANGQRYMERPSNNDRRGHQESLRDGGQIGVQNCQGNYDGVRRIDGNREIEHSVSCIGKEEYCTRSFHEGES